MQGDQFSIPITILEDGLPENLETFQVLLSSTSPSVSVLPALNTATVEILGDSKHMNHWSYKSFNKIHAGIVFEFSQNTYNVDESDPFVEVCIDLVSGVLSVDTTIVLTPAQGTAGGI